MPSVLSVLPFLARCHLKAIFPEISEVFLFWKYFLGYSLVPSSDSYFAQNVLRFSYFIVVFFHVFQVFSFDWYFSLIFFRFSSVICFQVCSCLVISPCFFQVFSCVLLCMIFSGFFTLQRPNSCQKSLRHGANSL